MGSAHRGDPQVEDVLTSLAIDASCGAQSYHEFLSEFGYEDEPRWRKMHKACVRTEEKLRSFLGPSDYESLTNPYPLEQESVARNLVTSHARTR